MFKEILLFSVSVVSLCFAETAAPYSVIDYTYGNTENESRLIVFSDGSLHLAERVSDEGGPLLKVAKSLPEEKLKALKDAVDAFRPNVRRGFGFEDVDLGDADSKSSVGELNAYNSSRKRITIRYVTREDGKVVTVYYPEQAARRIETLVNEIVSAKMPTKTNAPDLH